MLCEDRHSLGTLYLTSVCLPPAQSPTTNPRSNPMADRRKVEVFSAGCSVCEDAVALVRHLACASCDVEVLDMSDVGVAERAEELGVQSLPAVAVNGTLAECCSGRGMTEEALQAEGIGEPIA